jgi:iron complex outermembrane receptor protein
MKKSVEMSFTKLATAVAFAAAATSSGSLMAQDDIEEIQVTGSFISRPADRPQPVSIMDNEELQANQRVSVVEAIRDMPQISSANTTGNFNTPTNSINLRGLGARSTLVLLNGQRQTIDANSGSQVDVNNLAPGIMIERVELVLDGASALYGSDAVAGVANFITRNNFEGAEISLSTQHAQAQSSIPEALVGGIFGVQGDSMGIVMAVEFLKRGDEMQSQDVFDGPRLGLGLITGLANPGTFGSFGIPGNQSGFIPDPLCGSPLIGGLEANVIYDPAGATGFDGNGFSDPSNSFCRMSLSHQRTIIPEVEQLVGMSVVTKQFDGDFLQNLTFESNYARVESLSSFGTGVPLLALTGIGVLVPANNPGVIDANQRDPNFPLQSFNRVFTRQAAPVEGALPSISKQHTFRTSLSLDGMLGGSWDWRMTGTASWNQQESGSSDSIADRYARAVAGYGGGNCKANQIVGYENSGLVPGEGNCEWWNPFASRLLAQPGDATYNSVTLQQWMTNQPLLRGTSQLFSLEFVTTGELWEMAGGVTGVAIGAQYRKQELDIIVDSVARDGGYAFNNQTIEPWDSNRDTEAVFAEIVMYPTDTLEIDIAARYESTLGQSSVEPKISALWTPTDNLFIRASAGSSFRLASENQSFGIGPSGTTIREIGGEVTQARALAVGNPNLAPEESDSWTIGLTWDITDSISLDLNYWEYEFTNLVTVVSPDDILLADQADGFITDPRIELFPGAPNEICEITGRWDGINTATRPADCMTGFSVSLFKSGFINQDTVETNGVDFQLSYDFPIMGGDAGLRLNGAYVNRYAGTATDGTLIDVVGTDGGNVAGVGTNPQLRGNIVATYNRDNHSFRWTTRFTDGTELRNPRANQALSNEGGFSVNDLLYTYNLETDNASSVSLAILNIGDKEAPLVNGSLTTVNSSLYDPRRRMYRLSYNYSF